jgi:hypothetical protein
MFSSRLPQPGMKTGSFNHIIIRRLIELIDNSVKLILVAPLSFDVGEDIILSLHNKSYKILYLKSISAIKSVFSDTKEF